jgi:hypothetical protein
MKQSEAIAEFAKYERQLASILDGFIETRDAINIDKDDDPRYRQYAQELIDLFNDMMGDNAYSKRISSEFSAGMENFTGSPSYKSVENILGVLRAALTRMRRNRDVLRFADADDASEPTLGSSNATALPRELPVAYWDTTYWGAARWGGDPAEMVASPVLHARMLARLEAIEVAIDRLTNPAELIGHNNPPEPIDDILPLKELSEIKEALEILKSQKATEPPENLAQVTASAERLKTIGEKLSGHLDTFADEFTRSMGKEAGKRLVQAPFWIPLGLQLIDAGHIAISWIASLPH